MDVGNTPMEEQLQYQFIKNAEIGGWLFKEILSQLGITEEQFDRLK